MTGASPLDAVARGAETSHLKVWGAVDGRGGENLPRRPRGSSLVWASVTVAELMVTPVQKDSQLLLFSLGFHR